MRFSLFLAVAVGLFGALAVPATAATVTYDLTAESASTHRASLTEMGLTAEIEAYKVYDPVGADTDGDIRSNSSGWGVSGNPAGGQIGLTEALAFNFSSDVLLHGLSIFSNSTNTTVVSIFDYATDNLLAKVSLGGVVGFKSIDLSGLGLTGGSFVFQRDTGVTFFLSSVSVSAIPVPASALLLLGGLGALGAMRRRRG